MRAHLAAIAALVPDGIPVFDTAAERPNYDPSDWTATWSAAQRAAWTLPEPARWVILSAPTFPKVADTLDDVPRDVRGYVRVTTVDVSARGARWVQESVRAVLDRAAPVVTGYSANLRHSTADVFAKDDDSPTDLYYAVDSYLYQATPST